MELGQIESVANVNETLAKEIGNTSNSIQIYHRSLDLQVQEGILNQARESKLNLVAEEIKLFSLTT